MNDKEAIAFKFYTDYIDNSILPFGEVFGILLRPHMYCTEISKMLKGTFFDAHNNALSAKDMQRLAKLFKEYAESTADEPIIIMHNNKQEEFTTKRKARERTLKTLVGDE